MNNQLADNLRTSKKPISIPFICALWLPLILLLLFPSAGRAQYTYTTNNGAITITGYTNASGIVTIPGTINGLPVTSIGFRAFASLPNLTSVAISKSVTNIGFRAFFNC